MKRLFCLLIVGLVVFVVLGVAQETAFEPARFERDVELSLDGSPQDVFELFSLEGRQKLRGAHAMPVELVFAGRGGESGAMSRTIHPGQDYGDAWDVIADYDPDALTMRRVHYEPNTELLVEELALESAGHGMTRAKINWRVVGLTEEGNRAVQAFMENRFDASMKRLEQGINDYLRGRQPDGRAH